MRPGAIIGFISLSISMVLLIGASRADHFCLFLHLLLGGGLFGVVALGALAWITHIGEDAVDEPEEDDA